MSQIITIDEDTVEIDGVKFKKEQNMFNPYNVQLTVDGDTVIVKGGNRFDDYILTISKDGFKRHFTVNKNLGIALSDQRQIKEIL